MKFHANIYAGTDLDVVFMVCVEADTIEQAEAKFRSHLAKLLGKFPAGCMRYGAIKAAHSDEPGLTSLPTIPQGWPQTQVGWSGSNTIGQYSYANTDGTYTLSTTTAEGTTGQVFTTYSVVPIQVGATVTYSNGSNIYIGTVTNGNITVSLQNGMVITEAQEAFSVGPPSLLSIYPAPGTNMTTFNFASGLIAYSSNSPPQESQTLEELQAHIQELVMNSLKESNPWDYSVKAATS